MKCSTDKDREGLRGVGGERVMLAHVEAFKRSLKIMEDLDS